MACHLMAATIVVFTWTNVDLSSVKPCVINQRSFSLIVFKMLITKMCLKSQPYHLVANELTHWGRVTHISIGKLTIIGSDSGLLPGRRQSIIWSDGGILLIGPLGINFSEVLIKIQTFSLKKIHFNLSVKCCSFCLDLNVFRPKVQLDFERFSQPFWLT